MRHYIYFIAESGKGPCYCKIGVSKNPDKRMEDLQISNARQLVLQIKMGPFSEFEAYAIEKKLHKVFDKYSVRGEWFKNRVLTRMGLIEKYEENQKRRRLENKLAKKERKRMS